jgi:hypothetical protein
LILLDKWCCSKKQQAAQSLVFGGFAAGAANLPTILSTDFWGILLQDRKSAT